MSLTKELVEEATAAISQWPSLIRAIRYFAEHDQPEHAETAVRNLYESWKSHGRTAVAATTIAIETTSGELCIAGGQRATTWMNLVNGIVYSLLHDLFFRYALNNDTGLLEHIDRELTKFDPAIVGRQWETARIVIAELPDIDWNDLACEVTREGTLVSATIRSQNPAKDVKLNDCEQSIVQALREHGPMKGADIAVKAGYPADSGAFRGTLSALVRHGILMQIKDVGYSLPECQHSRQH